MGFQGRRHSPETRERMAHAKRLVYDKVELADTIVEAVRESGPTAAARVVSQFAESRPDSSVVRLMFPESEEEEG